MKRFTHQNTFGYTSKQLAELNRRLEIAIETCEPESDEEIMQLEDTILNAFDNERRNQLKQENGDKTL